MADDMDMVPWWPGKRAEHMVPLVGKRGGNKKETVGSLCGGLSGMREDGRAPPSPRPLACSWVDARMAEDMDMVPWWPRKEGRQRQGTVGSGAVWIDCHGYNRTRLAV